MKNKIEQTLEPLIEEHGWLDVLLAVVEYFGFESVICQDYDGVICRTYTHPGGAMLQMAYEQEDIDAASSGRN